MYKCNYKGKTCVVKIIKVEGTFYLKSAQNELKILKRMKHPRIVALLKSYSFDSMIKTEQFNIVLEYMDNGSLRDILKKYEQKSWKFGQPDLLALFMDMAVGLKYLHYRFFFFLMCCKLRNKNKIFIQDLTNSCRNTKN